MSKVEPDKIWLSWNRTKAAQASPRLRSIPMFPEAEKTSFPLHEHWFPTDGGEISGRVCPSGTCSRCELSGRAKHICLGTGASPSGGILVVYDQPTLDEDERGHAFTGSLSDKVRQTVIRLSDGKPTHFIYAVRCAGLVTDAALSACRPHLWYDWDLQKPERVIAVGVNAIKAIFGRYFDPLKVRKGWAFYKGVPVFLVPDAHHGAHNRFYQKQVEQDLEWAATEPLPAPIEGTIRVLTTVEETSNYLRGLRKNEPTGRDVEHDGTLWNAQFRLLCVGFCQDVDSPVVVPGEVALASIDAVREFLADVSIPKVNHNLKHDRQAMYRAFGVDMQAVDADTMLRASLRDPEERIGLAWQAWRVGFGGYKDAAVSDDDDEADEASNKWARMAPDTLRAYNGRDCSATLRLYFWQMSRVGAKLERSWSNLVRPAFEALAHVERNGVLVSTDAVRSYDRWLQANLDLLLIKIKQYGDVPKDFDPSKPAQVRELLYEKLKLRCRGTTKTGIKSVAAEFLVEMTGDHPIIESLITHSELRTQQNRYGLPILDYVSPLDGRIHTTFKLARSQRLRSGDPGLQNVTRSDEPGDAGSWARGCYVAAPGYKLVHLDYSQLELRIAAMLSGDEAMIEAFRQGLDMHTKTGSVAFKVDYSVVTKKQRAAAKPLNFAIVYGGDEFGISKTLKCPIEEARALIGNLLDTYTGLAKWRKMQVGNAEVLGEIKTLWDPPGAGLGWFLQRGLWPIGNSGQGKVADRIRKHWKNAAINTPIQFVANCYGLASLIEAVRWTQEERPEVKVILPVHDAIMLEAPEALVEETVREVRSIMLRWDSGGVPLKVDAEVGDDWGHLVKVA